MSLTSRTHSITGALCLLFIMPSLARAQDAAKPKMTTEQIELLNQANRELVKDKPDLKAAEDLVNAALDRGERFDLLLLTSGRILQKQDRCEEAKQLFGEINVAPHEPSQTVEDIKRIKNKYIEQMETLCSAQLALTCAEQDTLLMLSAQEVRCGETIKLTPGAYQLVATLDDNTDSYDIELGGAELHTFRVGLVRVEEVAEELSERAEETGEPTTDKPASREKKQGKVVQPAAFEDAAEPLPSPQTPPESRVIVEPARPHYRRTIISGVTTLVLTGASAGTWYTARRQKEAALAPYTNADGSPNGEGTERERANAESTAQMWGRTELISGYGVPVIAGVGLLTTFFIWRTDAREAERWENLSWQLDLGPDHAGTGVMYRW